MITDLAGTTSHLIELALDVALQRQQVIASNIANADSSGYRPLSVRFEEYLDTASTANGNRRVSDSELNSIRDMLTSGQLVGYSGDDKVNYDQEIARMSENVLRYQALLAGLNKYGDIVQMAISGDRGK